MKVRKYLKNWSFSGLNEQGEMILFNVNQICSLRRYPMSEKELPIIGYETYKTRKFLVFSKTNKITKYAKFLEGLYPITLSNGMKLYITDVNMWHIIEGDLWFENHKEDLGEKLYNRIKKEYEAEQQDYFAGFNGK